MSEVFETMGEEFSPVEMYENDGYSIKDDRGAEYALKRIRETQAEVDKFREYYDLQIQKMQERADGIRGFYLGHLYKYFQSVPHKSTKTQESYELPSAKLVWKQQNPEYVRDDEKVITWLKNVEETGFIKVKESLDWAELKKKSHVSDGVCVLNETGEVIPGIDVVERDAKFDVTFKGGK